MLINRPLYVFFFLFMFSNTSVAQETSYWESMKNKFWSSEPGEFKDEEENEGEENIYQSYAKQPQHAGSQVCSEEEHRLISKVSYLLHEYQVQDGYVGGGESIKIDLKVCLYDKDTESYATLSEVSWKGSYLKISSYSFTSELGLSPMHGAYALSILQSSMGEKIIPSSSTALTGTVNLSNLDDKN
jgi:hypothetical protein